MAKKNNTQVSIDRVCKTCALYDPASGYCWKKNEATPGLRYACESFMTPEEFKADCEARRKTMEQTAPAPHGVQLAGRSQGGTDPEFLREPPARRNLRAERL